MYSVSVLCINCFYSKLSQFNKDKGGHSLATLRAETADLCSEVAGEDLDNDGSYQHEEDDGWIEHVHNQVEFVLVQISCLVLKQSPSNL